jgi:hypothetical protein
MTAFETAWDEFQRLPGMDVDAVLRRADVLAGLGRYAVILMADGAPDLQMPMKTGTSLLFLRPFSEEQATISESDFDVSPSSERFGEPKYYTIRGIGSTGAIARKVHYSRVIHVPSDGPLDDELYGEPRLEGPWNLLDDLDKVTGGGSEAFWMRANQGMQFDVDPDLKLDPKSVEEMAEQVDEFVHNQRRVLRTRGVTINTLGSDVANFGPQADAILTQIAGGSGIPKRILLGSEMGELASTQDRANWNDRVSDRRIEHAGPHIVAPFVNRLIELKILPTPAKNWEILWAELQFLTMGERSRMAKDWVALNKPGAIVVTTTEIRQHCFGFEPLDEKDLENEKTLQEAGAPPPPVVTAPLGPDGKPIPPSEQSPASKNEVTPAGEEDPPRERPTLTDNRGRLLEINGEAIDWSEDE